MATFRTQVKNFAARAWLVVAKRVGVEITFSQPNEADVTLWCVPGAARKTVVDVLGTDSEADERDFEIGVQDGFESEDAHCVRVITCEGHKYHINGVTNPDTVEAIFVLTGTCTHPNIIGVQ